MIVSSLMATLHHICAFTLTACLIYELVTFRRTISVEEARRIQRADLWYGISAGVIIFAGFSRVFFFEKGPDFYFHNILFWVKMSLFLIVGLLSIYPTTRFLKWNPLLKENKPPEFLDGEYKRIHLMLWLEAVGILLILFVAPAMARGIWIT